MKKAILNDLQKYSSNDRNIMAQFLQVQANPDAISTAIMNQKGLMLNEDLQNKMLGSFIQKIARKFNLDRNQLEELANEHFASSNVNLSDMPLEIMEHISRFSQPRDAANLTIATANNYNQDERAEYSKGMRAASCLNFTNDGEYLACIDNAINDYDLNLLQKLFAKFKFNDAVKDKIETIVLKSLNFDIVKLWANSGISPARNASTMTFNKIKTLLIRANDAEFNELIDILNSLNYSNSGILKTHPFIYGIMNHLNYNTIDKFMRLKPEILYNYQKIDHEFAKALGLQFDMFPTTHVELFKPFFERLSSNEITEILHYLPSKTKNPKFRNFITQLNRL